MDPGFEMIEGGLWGLFLGSFLAATILPFSSEAILTAAAFGPWSTSTLWIVASLGNWLGGMSCYAIGRMGSPDRIGSWLRMDPTKAQRFETSVKTYGAWLALLTWVPLIGDPLAVALGLGKAKLPAVTVLMFVGKSLRYALLLAALR